MEVGRLIPLSQPVVRLLGFLSGTEFNLDSIRSVQGFTSTLYNKRPGNNRDIFHHTILFKIAFLGEMIFSSRTFAIFNQLQNFIFGTKLLF